MGRCRDKRRGISVGPRFHHWMSAFAASVIMMVSLLAPAYAAVVRVPVETPPDIDPSVYRRIAVVPFASNVDEFPAGELAAKAVREYVNDKGIFLVEDAGTVQSVIDGIDFDPAVRASCLEVGKVLGADAVLTGKVEFYTQEYSPEGYRRNELYTAEHGSAPFIDLGPHFTTKHLDVDMFYRVDLTVKVIDVGSGRLVRRRETSASSEKTYEADEFPLSTKVRREIFNELLEDAAAEYASAIESRDVDKERYMAEL